MSSRRERTKPGFEKGAKNHSRSKFSERAESKERGAERSEGRFTGEVNGQ